MALLEIITSFSKEEYATFKSFLKEKNKRHDTKNLQLSDLIRKNTDLKTVDLLLYGKPNRNAYYALHKRLLENALDFLAVQNLESETSDDLKIIKNIIAARQLYKKELFQAGNKIINKALTTALDQEFYNLALECYHTLIEYHHTSSEIDLTHLISKSKECQSALIQQEQFNMAYAVLKQKLQFSVELNQRSIQSIIESTFLKFNIKLQDILTYKSLFQLLDIINSAAHITHNFHDALPFFEQVYQRVNQKEHYIARNRYYHIQIHYLMANVYFRIRTYKRSINRLEEMFIEMKKDRYRYYSRFINKYILLLSLNQNYSGNAQKAITTIEDHFAFLKTKAKTPDLILALSMMYTQQENFKKALNTLNNLHHSDNWYEKEVGQDWVIKKELIRLILYFELQYEDLTSSQLRRCKRQFKKMMTIERRFKNFLSTFETIYKNPDVVVEERFRESVKKSFPSDNIAQEDVFLVSFYAWLHSKLKASNLFRTTLELVNYTVIGEI